MNSFRDWVIHHPTTSEPFNVVFWLGLVAFGLSLILRRMNKNN